MSETRWTPGPWEVRWKRVTVSVYAPNGDYITENIRRLPNQEANVHLIAAAPDLYAELTHLVRLLEPQERDGGLSVPGLATLNAARAALAKARGEQP